MKRADAASSTRRRSRFQSFVAVVLLAVLASATVLASLVGLASASYEHVLFSDGFESGDFSAWTTTEGSPSVVGTPVYEGSYAMEAPNEGDVAVKSGFAASDTVHVKQYFRLNALPISDTFVEVIRAYDTGSNIIWRFQARRDSGGTLRARFRYLYPSDTTRQVVYTWQVDTWHSVEVKFVRHPSNGEYRVWIDGSEEITDTGLDTSGAGQLDQIKVGDVNKSGAYTVTVYVDNVEVRSVESAEVDTYDSDYLTWKDTYTLTETVYAKATGINEQAGWLSGWGNRVKLTIDSSDVDSDLSDFPVLVHLSTSSGRLSDDVSFVFDELQSDGNRKKIAVTKSDGTTECYVEIEKWDDASEEAWLWVKVSGTNSISSTTDTDLYLYYDKDHAENTAYVGDVDSAVAQNVWDTNFVGVWHLGETTGGANAIKDSTPNDNDGTDQNSPTLGATGKIGNAIDFDGNNQDVEVSDDPSLDIAGALTLEAWIQTQDNTQLHQTPINKAADDDASPNWHRIYSIRIQPNDIDPFGLYDGTTWHEKSSSGTFANDTWYHIVCVSNGTHMRIYIDGTEDGSPASGPSSIATSNGVLSIGSRETWTTFFNGLIDEVRISNASRTTAWVKASYESGRDDLIDFGTEETGWLSGWGKRVKLTIDKTDVDSDLSDFPVLIYLSTSSGRGPDDVSFIFDELQSDANRKKIAVTKSDGTTECYVEIEDWDDASEEAWLWVKVSGTNSISSTTDTDLYLYYDADHADNTAYVGDPNSTPAENVWDSNFAGVWHLGESSSTRYDSTANDNDLTPLGTVTASSSGKVGSAVSFAVSPEGSLYITDNAVLSITQNLTISAWINLTSLPSVVGDEMAIVSKRVATTNNRSYHLRVSDASPTDGTRAHISDDGISEKDADGGTTLSTSTWYYVTLVYDSTDFRLYLNDSLDSSGDNPQSHTTGIYDATADFHIGRRTGDLGDEMDGMIDEVRVSNTDRSAAWVKASYNSETDDLIDFGSEESRRCDFRYYSDWTGTPDLEYEDLSRPEDAAGGWRSSYETLGTDPTGTWGVKVFEAGTSILICSCSFTVQAVPEFAHGAMALLAAGFAIFLAKRKKVRTRVKAS